MNYSIRLTRLANAFAEVKYGGVAVVEERVRSEIAKEEVDTTEPFLLTIPMGELEDMVKQDTPDLLICVPDPETDGGVIVDTGHYEEGSLLEEGPFAGKTVMFPVPDSDELNR